MRLSSRIRVLDPCEEYLVGELPKRASHDDRRRAEYEGSLWKSSSDESQRVDEPGHSAVLDFVSAYSEGIIGTT